MQTITGEVAVTHGGQEYRLFLGMRGIGKLQEEFGKDLAPFMGLEDDGDDKAIPEMTPLLRVIEVSLARYHPEADPYLADALLAADLGLPGKLIAAAIPGAEREAPPAGGRATAARAGKQKVRR